MAKYRDNSGRFVGSGDIEDQQEDDVGLYGIENPYAGKNLNLNELFYENDSVIESIRNYYADRKGEIKVNNRKELVEIDIKIQEEELILEYLEKIQNIVNNIQWDIKNLIELEKLELQ